MNVEKVTTIKSASNSFTGVAAASTPVSLSLRQSGGFFAGCAR
jgi:hypothetical protein